MDKVSNVNLGSVIEINPSSLSKQYPYTEIEYIDITSVGSGFFSGSANMPLSEAPSRAKRLVKHGDTIISTVRPNLRSFLYIKNPNSNTVVSTGFAVLRPSNKIHSRFLYYTVTNQKFTDYLSANVKGAAYPAVDMETFARAEIWLPDMLTQHKIASILSAYDDLIENNLRRIKILEEMAKAIYDEWFVKFRFPGHEKVKMVESELGLIPEGWEITTIGNVVATIESGSRPKGGIDPEAKGIPSIGAENIIGLGRYDYSKEKFVTPEFFDNMNRGHIHSGDVLLYKDGAQIGRKSMFKDGFPHIRCCINEHVFILRTNERCTQNYLFFWLDQPDLTQKIINLNANAAQPGINQSGVRSLPILLPPIEMLNNVEQIMEPMLQLLFNCAKKNNILRQTRDLLLPKLISGEIDVENLDIRIGDLDEPDI